MDSVQEWDEIINAIGGLFKHADSCSFELSEKMVPRSGRSVCLQSSMIHHALVKWMLNEGDIPIGKTLKFVKNLECTSNLHSKLSTCECERHADMNRQLFRDFLQSKTGKILLVESNYAAK